MKHGENLYKLYLIEFLHQTTTVNNPENTIYSCILLNFYIKPQPDDDDVFKLKGCILLNFYIKPQRESVSSDEAMVVSY